MYIRLFICFAVAISMFMLPDFSEAGLRKERRSLAERIHNVKREGRKVCVTGHVHYGVSDWNRNKKLSYKEAVNSWSVFTKVEYGKGWSNFKMAGNRKVLCRKNARRLWRCDAEGRPCRRK